jgi:hypothetical protein
VPGERLLRILRLPDGFLWKVASGTGEQPFAE